MSSVILLGSQVDPGDDRPTIMGSIVTNYGVCESQTILTQTFNISYTNKFVPITGPVMGIIELQTRAAVDIETLFYI